MDKAGLTARALRMMTRQGFAEVFWEAVRADGGRRGYEEVYEGLEAEYRAVFGRRRYASYDSFRRRR